MLIGEEKGKTPVLGPPSKLGKKLLKAVIRRKKYLEIVQSCIKTQILSIFLFLSESQFQASSEKKDELKNFSVDFDFIMQWANFG